MQIESFIFSTSKLCFIFKGSSVFCLIFIILLVFIFVYKFCCLKILFYFVSCSTFECPFFWAIKLLNIVLYFYILLFYFFYISSAEFVYNLICILIAFLCIKSILYKMTLYLSVQPYEGSFCCIKYLYKIIILGIIFFFSKT